MRHVATAVIEGSRPASVGQPRALERKRSGQPYADCDHADGKPHFQRLDDRRHLHIAREDHMVLAKAATRRGKYQLTTAGERQHDDGDRRNQHEQANQHAHRGT